MTRSRSDPPPDPPKKARPLRAGLRSATKGREPVLTLAVVADAASNVRALSAVLARAKRGANAIVVLGGSFAVGPRPRATLRRLTSVPAIVLDEGKPADELGAFVRSGLTSADLELVARFPRELVFELAGVRVLATLQLPEAIDEAGIDEVLAARQVSVILSSSGPARIVKAQHGIFVAPGSAGRGCPRGSFATVRISRRVDASIEQVPTPIRKLPREIRKIARKHEELAPALEAYLLRWIEEVEEPVLKATTTGADLALAVLGPRLREVYGAAVRPWPSGPELVDWVHDVRVASRRLREGLALLEPILGKRGERAKERVSSFGQLLGARRAADVLVEHATKAERHHPDAAVVFAAVRGHAEALRAQAFAALLDGFPQERALDDAFAILDVAMRAGSDFDLRWLATRHLARRLAEALDQLGAIDDPVSASSHHELRIRLKRLRYTVEILRSVFPSADQVASLKHIQDDLGEKHDLEELRAGLNDPALAFAAEAMARAREILDAKILEHFEAAGLMIREEGPELFGRLGRLLTSLERGAARRTKRFNAPVEH
ncbi:MAG: CHAD domain-containing protein [Deltaproteobacteria bacterium]|nr:CHAD domain-containing protein [Deltaproteobacteria bacterium]